MSASVGGDEIDVNLTPLLDLVLQLIMFFIITVNFVRLDQFDESVRLPVALSAVRLEESDGKMGVSQHRRQWQVGRHARNFGHTRKLKSYLILEKESNERVAPCRRSKRRSENRCRHPGRQGLPLPRCLASGRLLPVRRLSTLAITRYDRGVLNPSCSGIRQNSCKHNDEQRSPEFWQIPLHIGEDVSCGIIVNMATAAEAASSLG